MSNDLYEFKKPVDDNTTEGGRPDTGYVQINNPGFGEPAEPPHDNEEKRDFKKPLIICLLILCVLVGGAALIRFLLTSSSEVDVSQLTPETHDINFSHVDDLETSSVDVLIRVRNDSDKPIKSIKYRIQSNGNSFKNRLDDSNLFYAIGQIEPKTTGYMFSQIYIPGDTPQKQGEIIIDSAEKGKDLGDYQVPSGQITGFNSAVDSYDVWILNPNKDDVNLRESVVIAVAEDCDSLAGAWGCSTQQDLMIDRIPAEQDVTLTNAIHDPDFSDKYTSKDKDKKILAFVIEKEVIGVE